MRCDTMKSATKYLLVLLALAALATGKSTSLHAQSIYSPDVSTADRNFAVFVRLRHLHNYFPDDNPRGQQGSYSPADH
jgi:hypothetical protein